MPGGDELRAVLRDQVFEAILETADLAGSYSKSLGEAAYRGDERTVAVHLRQLRECCVSMFKTYKDYLEGPRDGQGMAAAEAGPSDAHRADQRSGDVVA
jgi:hypothetical protein